MHSSSHLNSDNAVTGVFGKLVERSGQAVNAFGSRLRGLVEPARTRPVPQDPETVKERAMQSARINLRLLAKEQNWAQIVRIAETTDNDDIAAVAILEIVSNADQYPAILARLAEGFTRSTLRAIIALINNNYVDQAMEIFFARLENGEIGSLVERGLANPFSILDILGMVGDEQIMEHFEQFWHCLGRLPERQYKLMGQILGDPDPLSCRYKVEGNLVPLPVKFRALELSRQFVPADRERALWFATRDENEDLAYHATVELANHWQSDSGIVPYGLEPFPLLDVSLLHYLCSLSASFQWSEPSGAEQAYEGYRQYKEELAELNPDVDANAYQAVLARLESAEEEIKQITERRVNCLQPLLNQISRALNLPNAMLSATDRDCCAAYVVGTGCIEVNRDILMEDKPLSEELMSSLLHEMGHMEQDVLVIRKIADDLNLVFGQHSKLLLPLYERYAAGIGYAPQSMFLLAVLRLRNDQRLNEMQRKRAERLHEAAYQTAIYASQAKSVSERLSRLASSSGALEEGRYDSQLLSCLSNQRALDSLFRRGEVPGVLLYEINTCNQELEQTLNEIYGARRPRKSAVELAKALLNSPHHAERIQPIVERLRAVLLQVLSEEYQKLEKTLVELKRAGYHESEAYTISDRVEVLVKALRMGWLQA